MSILRTFIALELPENILAGLGQIQKDLKARGLKIRWTPMENIHLTLKFLGDTTPEQVAGVTAVLSKAAEQQGHFVLTAKGAGVFPNLRRPNVFWIGLSGPLAPLAAFQQELDQDLLEFGFAMEKRPFKGHLTIGRFKGGTDSGRLIEAIRSLADWASPQFEARALTLFKSDLQPQGAVYSRLASFVLK